MLLLLLLSVSTIHKQATTFVQAQAQAQRHQLRGAIGDQRSLLVESAATTTATSTSSSTNHFSTREKNSSNKNKANKINDSSPILVPLRESSSSLSSLSSSFTSSNTTDDDDNIDSDNEENSCLVESVCSIPELETLCGLMMSLALPLPSTNEDNNSNNNSNSTTATGSNGFLFFNNDNTTTNSNINTFFAPTNDAFASLPLLVANDVTTNQDIFRNVLMYHTVVDDVDNNDIPITVNELVCNEELLMMNQETTKTVCRISGDGDDDEKSKKIQLGVGNRPMRSLPTIIEGNIEACDGTIFIHIVNQVILPALPLSSSSLSNANTNTNTNEEEDDNDDEEVTATIDGGIDDNENVNEDNEEEEKEEGTATINDGIDDNEDVNEDNEEQEKEEGTATIDGRIDDNEDEFEDEGEGEEKNHNWVHNNKCGGILETVCSLSGLETLCDYLQLLQNNDNDHGLEFLAKSGGTFFAPLNIAFARLPSHIVLDLQDISILANVLEYHAVRKISSTDALNPNTAIDTDTDPFDTNTPTNDTGGSSTLLFVDELVCENELVMMNSKTTRTLCLTRGDMRKIQVGFGNMPMRTLPNILPVRSDIVTCDRTGIIHMVDQVIIPGLPLSGSSSFGSSSGSGGLIEIIPPPEENDNENDNIGSLPEEAMVEDNVLPEPPQQEEALVEPPTIIDESVVCPEVPTLNGPCETRGDVCEYQHVLMGCTWEELQCRPIVKCECDDDGTWGCFTFDQSMCGGGGGGSDMSGSDSSSQQVAMSPSNDEGSNIVVPEGLPRGVKCRPNDELPTQKPPSSLSPSDFNIYSVEDIDVDTTTTTTTTNRFDDVRDGKNITGRGQLSTECPQFVNPAGPCSDTYESNLVCKYDYIQLGCSWEELQCLPIMRCECNQFNDGNWACRTDSMMGCDTATTPPDFPSGKVCDPADDKWNN